MCNICKQYICKQEPAFKTTTLSEKYDATHKPETHRTDNHQRIIYTWIRGGWWVVGVGGVQVVFVSLHTTLPLPHYHHYADTSESIELLRMLFGYVLSSVCLRLIQFSQLSFMYYMGLCVLFSLPISFVMMIVWIYLIIIIKSEVSTIRHWSGLGFETMVWQQQEVNGLSLFHLITCPLFSAKPLPKTNIDRNLKKIWWFGISVPPKGSCNSLSSCSYCRWSVPGSSGLP